MMPRLDEALQPHPAPTMSLADPFVHLPHLRHRINPPEASAVRMTDAVLAAWDQRARDVGRPEGWRMPDAAREATRRALLADHDPSRDLWVFAYGSLMWDPAVHFAEVRMARVDGHVRRFTCKGTVGRGSPEHPALFLALEPRPAGHCTGLAFRIPAASVDAETTLLWRREMLVGSYAPRLLPIQTPQGEVRAIAFAANPAHPDHVPEMGLTETAATIAAAVGLLGTNLAYLEQLAVQLDTLQIADGYVADVLGEVRRLGMDGVRGV